MSWADALRKAKEQEPSAEVKPVRVCMVTPSVDPIDRQLTMAESQSVDVHLPEYQKGLLILDANAIIKGMDNFVSRADAFVTTKQVISEVRDRAARDLLERLPHAVTVLDPTQPSISAVITCAEKTGDLGVLSRTDIRVCALALDCCTKAGVLNPPIDPKSAVVNATSNSKVVTEEKDEDEYNAEGRSDGDSEGESAEAEDDEGEWITPENIHQVKEAVGLSGDPFSGGMACATSDFAMQNTLLHLGVPIIGTSGMRIRELRLWLLRCTACFKIVMDTTRQFCPDCGGGNTLRRVNYVVNSNGEKQLFINFEKRISKRGTVYNLPKPRGGKNGTHRTLVLREDQLAQVLRHRSGTAMKEKETRLTEEEELAAFGEPEKKTKRNLGQPKTVSSYHKYNVNEMRKARAGRRK
ncbi:RNA-binding protein NOB1 [Strigomonas culicis]|uniref:RNA-binding protein NOB1 n=1 Tax=Strigomonas culicis TaxID=28005 RepID=S9UEY5_9TRYP|nr:RNA-binding protein NOB1 [Strigomonas culicis]|eukprot:EPY27284.1 RNA-binding protein NOB1 [Strigomonas culicis]